MSQKKNGWRFLWWLGCGDEADIPTSSLGLDGFEISHLSAPKEGTFLLAQVEVRDKGGMMGYGSCEQSDIKSRIILSHSEQYFMKPFFSIMCPSVYGLYSAKSTLLWFVVRKV